MNEGKTYFNVDHPIIYISE